MANTKVTQDYTEVVSSASSDVRVTQDYTEVLSSAESPHSRVTQDYTEVVSSGPSDLRVTQDYTEVISSPTSFIAHEVVPGPLYNTLGCGEWTVQIAERGGTRVLLEAAATTARTQARRDDMASIEATFAQSDVPFYCLDALSELEAWTYELKLLRDGELWAVGPIADDISWTRSEVSVKARDLFQWFERRILWSDHTDKKKDLSYIFRDYALDALSRDSSPNIEIDALPCGVTGTRSVKKLEYAIAADKMRELAEIGVDFMMVGRTLRVRAQDAGDVVGVLLDTHVTGDPTLGSNGLAAASEWVLQGKTTGPLPPAGISGGVSRRIGLVTRKSQNTDITEMEDLERGADELLAAAGTKPLRVTVALDADAPLRASDLVGGNKLDARLSFGWKTLMEVMTIDSVQAEVNGATETITLDLLRGSDAEAA